MKCLFIFSFLMCSIISLFAQQSSAANDSLLLDYYQNQRFAEAADYLKKTYPEPVSNVRALGKLAYTSQMAGRLPDAEGYYQRIYDTDSTNTVALFSLGAINLRRGNNVKAEVYYKMIAKKDSTNFLVYKQLGKIAGDKADFGSMIYYLQKANKINPAEPDVASDLSDLYVNLKQYPAAEKVLNGAIAQDPDNMILLQSLLKLVSSQDKFEETKNTCLKLTDLGNHSGYVLTKLGVAYYNLKNYTCSVETFADIPGMEQSETSFYVTALAYK
ncbi:MAG TPA: tetratricopeptide repeat protein, partial [Mucilaginibacter sp.]|nr:tetratricopeptide repeat protein [Mucilaginibacter sp.]